MFLFFTAVIIINRNFLAKSTVDFYDFSLSTTVKTQGIILNSILVKAWGSDNHDCTIKYDVSGNQYILREVLYDNVAKTADPGANVIVLYLLGNPKLATANSSQNRIISFIISVAIVVIWIFLFFGVAKTTIHMFQKKG